MNGKLVIFSIAISFLSSGCNSQGNFNAPINGSSASSGASTQSVSSSTTGSVVCGGGLTGVITANAGTTPLPGVSQYTCANIAVQPPFNGPNSSAGGTGVDFSFGMTAPGTVQPATLNNTMVIALGAQAAGLSNLSSFSSFIMYGYLNTGFCASPTGTINVTSLGSSTGAGTFSGASFCDMNGNVKYTNVNGSFHVP